jgi:hypothetical protein
MSAPVKGNTTASNPTPASASYTIAHNMNTGSDGLIIVMLTMNQIRSYTGVTYGGVAMTQLYTIQRGGLSQRMAFYYLQSPPTGNNDMVISFSSTVWNPISIFIHSFTGSGGIGNSLRTGGQSTPNIQSLTISQDDSLVIATACSVNVITSIEIPQGTSVSFTTHNVNRQVGTGAISGNSGFSAGSIDIETNSTFGSVTNDRTEILGLGGGGGTTNGDFFLVM